MGPIGKFQMHVLYNLNKIDKFLIDINKNFSLNGKYFRTFGITPRFIVQNRMRNIKSSEYDLPIRIKYFLKENYKLDRLKIKQIMNQNMVN